MARSKADPAADEKMGRGNGGWRGGHAPVALPLGLWRLKRMWGLLLVAQLGMIAAVLLVCAVPVFARVAVGAGFQAELAAHPGSAMFYAHTSTNQPTQQLVDSYTQRVESIRAGALRAYHVGQPQLELDTTPLTLPSSDTTTSAVGAYGVRPQAMSRTRLGGGAGLGGLSLGGEPAQSLAGDLRVTQGYLPQPMPDALEVVVSAATAAQLHLALGATLPLSAQAGARAPVVRVAGIVTLAATTFNYPLDPQTGGGPNGPTTYYWAVTSNEAILAYAYDWSQILQAIPAGTGEALPAWYISWTAPMDLSHLSAHDLGAILDGNPQSLNYQLIQLMNGNAGGSAGSTAPGNAQAGFASDSTLADSPLFDMLQDYQRRLIGAQILAGLLLADVLGLVLIFLTQMASMLVERQEPLIALLRSRGASRGQIFGAFEVQTLLLGVVGLVVGAALALPVAQIVSSALLPANERDTLSILDGSLVAVSTGAAIAALAVAVVLVLAMLRAVGRAAALNALAQRQESARPARKPLWQRLYLDVAAALLAFLAYGTYALANALAAEAPTTNPNFDLPLVLSPLAVIAPAFLMIAGALLFLRVFPLLLRLAERIAMRRSGGTAPVLALAQLARNARKTAGIVLPLALATCFLLFVLATNATIEQQITDAAAFQAGADFSGGLTVTPDPGVSGMRAREAAYAQVSGVRSVALGYRSGMLAVHCNPYTQGCGYGPQQEIQIAAVDADTFAQTAIWPPQDAAQPLAPLMAQLATQRDAAIARGTIPAILDRAAAASLNVAPGATFTLPAPVPINPNGNTLPSSGTADSPDLRYSVVAVVPYLPSTYGENGGGLLADYATFAAVYGSATGESSPAAVAPNFAWLRTADDTAALASVRAVIAKGPLALSELQESYFLPIRAPVSDRRALATGLHGDPLRLTVIGILDLGAVAALLLALCGTLIAAGVAARERGTALALLRALGTEPRRVRAEVCWEQGIVYGTALALGALLGAVLIEVMLCPLPLLIFASGLGGPITNGGPAARIIWPWPALAAVLGALIAICAVAALFAARLAARPSLARTLRLSGE